MQSFVYPVKLTVDKEDGGFVVTFRDLPEAISQGETSKMPYLRQSIVLKKRSPIGS